MLPSTGQSYYITFFILVPYPSPLYDVYHQYVRSSRYVSISMKIVHCYRLSWQLSNWIITKKLTPFVYTSASSANGAQFYVSCAQITVSGGSGSKTPSNLVSFPGAYRNTDPGLLINIYNNGGKTYQPAGPPVFTCWGGFGPGSVASKEYLGERAHVDEYLRRGWFTF